MPSSRLNVASKKKTCEFILNRKINAHYFASTTDKYEMLLINRPAGLQLWFAAIICYLHAV